MQGHAKWRGVRFYGLIVLLGMTGGALVGVALTERAEESYTASADVFVTARGGTTAVDAASAAELSEQQATNLAGLATREVVLSPVIDELDLDMTAAQLSENVDATVPLGTSIISVSASDPSPQQSADIANAVAASLAEVVDDLTSASPSTRARLTLQSIEEATAPTSPTTPKPLLNVVIGILAGLCIAVALIAVLDAFRRPDHR